MQIEILTKVDHAVLPMFLMRFFYTPKVLTIFMIEVNLTMFINKQACVFSLKLAKRAALF